MGALTSPRLPVPRGEGSRRQRGRQGAAASRCSLQQNAAGLAPGSAYSQRLSPSANSAVNSGGGGTDTAQSEGGTLRCAAVRSAPWLRAVRLYSCPGQGAGSDTPVTGLRKGRPLSLSAKADPEIWGSALPSLLTCSGTSRGHRSCRGAPHSISLTQELSERGCPVCTLSDPAPYVRPCGDSPALRPSPSSCL